jgi:hypothetical protein
MALKRQGCHVRSCVKSSVGRCRRSPGLCCAATRPPGRGPSRRGLGPSATRRRHRPTLKTPDPKTEHFPMGDRHGTCAPWTQVHFDAALQWLGYKGEPVKGTERGRRLAGPLPRVVYAPRARRARALGASHGRRPLRTDRGTLARSSSMHCASYDRAPYVDSSGTSRPWAVSARRA